MRYFHLLSSLALGVLFATSSAAFGLGQNDVPANDRLRIDPPTKDLQLASSNDIQVRISSDPVLQVIVDWKGANGETPDGSEEKEGLINFGANGQGMLGVHPPVLGRATMTVRVDFRDGRYAIASEDVNVGLPKRKPKTFEVTNGHGDEAVSRVDMDLDQNRIKRLGAVATYSGYKYPVSLQAAQLKFEVKPQSGQPAIDVDPRTGLMTAHSEGQALVDVRFGGQDRKVCVVVSKTAGNSASANCLGASK